MKDEIERLKAENERLWGARQLLSDALDTTKTKHERMQAEIEQLRDEAYRAWAMVQDKQAEIEATAMSDISKSIPVSQGTIVQLLTDKAAISQTASDYLHEIEQLRERIAELELLVKTMIEAANAEADAKKEPGP